MDLTPYMQLGGTAFMGFLIYRLFLNNQKSNERMIENLSSALAKNAKNTQENTKVTKETYDYLRVRNGTLERLVEADPKIKKAAKDVIKQKRKQTNGINQSRL